MKNILKIFKRDLKKIFTNSMAVILVIGVAVLPSLYAWFNIYANWDPYGNTGNMQVAVVINDEGYEYKDIKINVGDEIENSLKANDAIDWQFVSKDEAMQGIKGGIYYAAIEIPSGFSKSLTSIMTSNFEQPEIIYYANEKKNAIATKITDKVVQTVQTQVNESFIKTIVKFANALFGTIVEETENGNDSMLENLKIQVKQANESVSAVEKTLNSFEDIMKIAGDLNKSLNSDELKNLMKNTGGLIDDAQGAVTVAEQTVSAVTESVDTVILYLAQSMSDSAEELGSVENKSSDEALLILNQVLAQSKQAHDKLGTVISTLENINDKLIEPIDKLDSDIQKLKELDKKLLQSITVLEGIDKNNIGSDYKKVIATLNDVASNLKKVSQDYKNNIKPKLDNMVTDLVSVLNDMNAILTNLSGNTPTVDILLTSLENTANVGGSMLDSLRALLKNCHTQLNDLSSKLTNLSQSEIINTIVNMTEKNSDGLSEFIACPVRIKTDKVYGIDNYGSAMAPFYSTLAIWVGGIVLVAILKTNVKNKKEIGNVKPYQEFFGRWLTFMLLAVVQSLIICIGDLCFLRIQCFHPVKFVIAGVFAAVVFDFFIYSIVSAFGDIGKAVAVIMLVVQLGGCGGTFPIDVTPSLFRTLNPFMPFTFVIEAMRECICGEFGNYYMICLLKLCAYIAAGLVIGLFVRFIIKKPVRFFSKKIEETGLM